MRHEVAETGSTRGEPVPVASAGRTNQPKSSRRTRRSVSHVHQYQLTNRRTFPRYPTQVVEPARILAPGREKEDAMADVQFNAVRDTYRYLRLATLVIILMLGVAVVLEREASSCWQTSISAYYWTAAHSIFVAALCAVGACLIVYKGSSDTEDIVLNFSGFLAFIVAMVPTAREALCGPGLPTGYEVAAGLRNNVWAVFVAGVVAEVTTIILQRRSDTAPRPNWTARISRLIGWVVIGLGAYTFIRNPETFQARGHNIAAPTMFVGIIVVVLLNAYTSRRSVNNPKQYAAAYLAVAISMGLTLVAIVTLSLTFKQWTHAVILVEALLIAEFAAFWIIQTVELWTIVDKRALTKDADLKV